MGGTTWALISEDFARASGINVPAVTAKGGGHDGITE